MLPKVYIVGVSVTVRGRHLIMTAMRLYLAGKPGPSGVRTRSEIKLILGGVDET